MRGFWTWPGSIVVTGVVVGLVLGYLMGSVLLWLTIGAVFGVVVEAVMTSRRRNGQGGDRDPKS